MSEIDKLRKEIDKLDLELLKAINKRSRIAIKIGKTKNSKNLFRPNRQAEILKKIFSAKSNMLSTNIIFSFWRSLFFSQINLQGGISVITLKEIKNNILKEIYDYFTHDIKISSLKSLRTIETKIASSKNTILVLPYPSKKKNCDWWTKYSFDKTYIIACLPFIVDREKKANAVIISKHYPELEKGNDYFYLSKNKIIDKRLKLEAKANKSFLYKTNAIIKNTEMKFIGSSTKRYEVK
jgi:chorismate mutase